MKHLTVLTLSFFIAFIGCVFQNEKSIYVSDITDAVEVYLFVDTEKCETSIYQALCRANSLKKLLDVINQAEPPEGLRLEHRYLQQATNNVYQFHLKVLDGEINSQLVNDTEEALDIWKDAFLIEWVQAAGIEDIIINEWFPKIPDTYKN